MAQNYSFPVPYVHKVNMTLIKGKQINIHGFMSFIVQFMSGMETFSSFLSAIHLYNCSFKEFLLKMQEKINVYPHSC